MQSNSLNNKKDTSKNVQQFRNFIVSNQKYLQQEFIKFFHQVVDQDQQSINRQQQKDISSTQFSVNKLIEYLYEIFSLQRYKKNRKVSEMIKMSVQENVKAFLGGQSFAGNQFSFQNLKQILVFIIKQNSLFCVQYQKANLSPISQPMPLSIMLNITQRSQSFQEIKIQNQFQSPLSQANLQDNSQLIKKNSKILFQFYCRQQMELGGVITFDRLSQETNSLSLGKMLTFAKALGAYNQIITRDLLVSNFKKIAQGKKAIHYLKFYNLLVHFHNLDPYFYSRIGLLSDDIRKKLKYVKKPFNTKDSAPRQNIAIRNFSRQLTGHSGKTGDHLKQQLQVKKVEVQNLKKLQQIKQYMLWKQSKHEIISQRDLHPNNKKTKDLTLQMSFIGSIIHPQQQDQTYLKGHIIPSLQKSSQKSKFGNIFQSDRYSSLDKLTLRKQSVVSDIKKRIQEIQYTQRLKQQRNQSTQIFTNRKRYSHR